MSQENVEEKIKNLEQEILRLQAINEIQNLMGKYETIHTQQDKTRSWELFAQHTPDTWMDISSWGLFEGIENIKRVWTQGPSDKPMKQQQPPPQKFKRIAEHHLATPIIVVAKDGQTAKGTWHSPGIENGSWAWGRYAVDFVKEDGEWKFWHFKMFRTFMTPFDVCWTESEDSHHGPVASFAKPSTYHKPYNSDDWVDEAIPPAPKPYETWTEKDKGWFLRTEENF